MKIKAVVLDFDGTIVTADILSELCALVGKKVESDRLNDLFHQGKMAGLESLVERINFLKGLSIEQIRTVVKKEDHLQKGALELFRFFKANNIITIIASGSLMPLLEVYKEKLGVDYLIGSKPVIENGRIVSISQEDYSGTDFKVRDLTSILKELDISLDSLVAIGDSPADKGIFKLAAKSIVINPKGDIAEHADFIIENDLSNAVPILQNLMDNNELKREIQNRIPLK